MKKTDLGDRGAKVWSVYSLWMLKKLCKIDHKVLGLEKLPQGPFIVACKHQSMWETIIMHLIFHRPAYCYKKELLKIPFYGWYLTKMTGIAIDRKGGSTALRGLLKQGKAALEDNHTVILFPQGTRVPLDGMIDKYPYQPGVVALYLSCNVPVVPAALNSGVFWPKYGVRNPGTITIEFLEPIMPGLSKEEFNEKLEKAIEERSAMLVREANSPL